MGDEPGLFRKFRSQSMHALYDWLYGRAENPDEVDWIYETRMNPLLQAYLGGCDRSLSVLDLGSGSGRKAVQLAEMGCDVTAVEYEKKGVEWGREHASERGVDVEFIQADALKWESQKRYDVIMDYGLLHGFTAEQAQQYRNRLRGHLAESAEFFLAHFASKFPGDQYVFPIGPFRRGPDELIELLPSELELQTWAYHPEPVSRMGFYWFSTAAT